MPLSLEIFSIFVALGLSLSVFGFYKILYGILVGIRTKLYIDQSERNLQGHYPYGSDKKIITEFDRRPVEHLIPGALYVFTPLGLLAIYYNIILEVIFLVTLFRLAIAASYALTARG